MFLIQPVLADPKPMAFFLPPRQPDRKRRLTWWLIAAGFVMVVLACLWQVLPQLVRPPERQAEQVGHHARQINRTLAMAEQVLWEANQGPRLTPQQAFVVMELKQRMAMYALIHGRALRQAMQDVERVSGKGYLSRAQRANLNRSYVQHERSLIALVKVLEQLVEKVEGRRV